MSSHGNDEDEDIRSIEGSEWTLEEKETAGSDTDNGTQENGDNSPTALLEVP
jgi:hypothetical protein